MKNFIIWLLEIFGIRAQLRIETIKEIGHRMHWDSFWWNGGIMYQTPKPDLMEAFRLYAENMRQGGYPDIKVIRDTVYKIEVKTAPVSKKEVIDFAVWYSGMERPKVELQYKRYQREVIAPQLIPEGRPDVFFPRPPHSFCETPGSTCNMGYCDENGCINRKRNLVIPKGEYPLEWPPMAPGQFPFELRDRRPDSYDSEAYLGKSIPRYYRPLVAPAPDELPPIQVRGPQK